MENLDKLGYTDALRAYVTAGRCFFGICLGMQCLFESSEESPGVKGLGVIPGKVTRFTDPTISVPHMGWNALRKQTDSAVLAPFASLKDRFYFVHSFRVLPTAENKEWVLSLTDYGSTDAAFVSSVQKGSVCGCQFHPEKSGANGLNLLTAFLEQAQRDAPPVLNPTPTDGATVLAKRIIACLDVRENDSGDLVVTKGDQYDVREKEEGGDVKNLGKPVELARRYSDEGADEVTFLNITSFRGEVVDAPMLRVLELTSEHVFVPLCVGGGIRAYKDAKGVQHSSLDVAAAYFRSGADKVSIGSDAVDAAERYYAAGNKGDGTSSIEEISRVYGRQAVVISVDPKRVYVDAKEGCKHTVCEVPGGRLCWWQCTVKGGRETRDMDAFELAQACEALGAGEVLLNCIDMDGQNSGFDTTLVRQMKASVRIPVIASSGAGNPQHFIDVFRGADPDAGLAAGIFHRREVGIDQVKGAVVEAGIPCRV
uniref:Glutamine amidotransferase domain-containing protein n=1 Tax=Hemiselmis tepida TaxID=464990 RepID=A0A7S0VE98_9CRYP